MNKGQMKMAALIAVFLMVITIGGVAMWFYSFNITKTQPTDTTETTDTTEPIGSSDFYVDKYLAGNVDTAKNRKMDENHPDFPYRAYAKLKFTEKDFYTGSAVSGSGTIQLYDDDSEIILETLTFSSGTVTGTKQYASGTHLKFEVTESGYVNYFGVFTVPWTNDDDAATLSFDILIVDIPAAWEQSCLFDNDTSIADAGTLNTTTDLTAGEADLIFKNFNNYDDDGYASCYDFLKNVYRNAYFFLHFTGTGTDSVIIEGSDAPYQRKIIASDNDVWIFWKLSDEDLSRDLKSDGSTTDPNGRWEMGITLGLSGITTGDSVTCTYGVVYNADASYLQSNNIWFPQSGHTSVTDTLTIAP